MPEGKKGQNVDGLDRNQSNLAKGKAVMFLGDDSRPSWKTRGLSRRKLIRVLKTDTTPI